MKISDEQISKAIRYVLEGGSAAPVSCLSRIYADSTDPLLMDDIRRRLAMLPDVREDRVRELRAGLRTYDISSEEIAQKMLGRAIGDCLR